MDKEQILQMSRQENKNKDLHELEVGVKAGKVAAGFSIALCIIYLILANHLDYKGFNGYISFIFVTFTAASFYKAVKMKKEEHWIVAVIGAIVAAATIILHIKYLLGLV